MIFPQAKTGDVRRQSPSPSAIVLLILLTLTFSNYLTRGWRSYG